jgi:RHS repeat-associated protein
VTLYGLDVAGRRTSETNANLEVTQYGYNPADEITSLIDGLQHQRTWQYNQYGWVTNKTDGLNRTAFRYQYNPNGWLTNRWTPEKGSTAYMLDNVGNVTSVFYAGQNLNLSFGFDALNQLTSMNDLIGLTRFTRDAAGRITAESNAWTTVSRSYTNGLRTKLTIAQPGTNWIQTYNHDQAWRMTNTTTMAGGFLYQFLDARPQIPSAIYLPNGAYITNSYDNLARLKSTALQDHWRHTLDGYTYGLDALGLKTNILRDLGLTTNSVNVGYDNINQILSWNAKESDGTPRQNEQLGFGYDAANNLHTRVNGNLTQTFTADAADQLSNITRAGTYTLSGATPAPALNVTVNGQAAARYADMTFAATNLTLANGANTFTVIATNMYGLKKTNAASANLPVNTGFTYDNNGNLTNDGTKAFFYDTENQITNVTVANSFKKDFVYDGLNRLRIKREYGWTNNAWLKTNEIRFIWDGNVIVQLRDLNNVPTLTLTRGLDLSGSLQGAGGIGGLLALTDNSGTSYYYHQDGIGNVTALMDGREQVAYRAAYDPFNRIIRQTGNFGLGIFGASGQFYDQDTRLLHYQRRVYSPELARWLNQDSIQEWGGINLYGFVGNNPLSWVDPLGFQKAPTTRPGLRPTGPGAVPPPPRMNPNGTRRPATPEEQLENAESRMANEAGARARLRDPSQNYLDPAPGSEVPETPEQVQAAVDRYTKEMVENAQKQIEEREKKQVAPTVPCPKTFQTYTKPHPEKAPYSGRTSGTGSPEENIAARDKSHHMNDQGYEPAQLDKSSSNPDAIRGREQQNIKANGGAQSTGGSSGNAINGVSPNNPKGPIYDNAANSEFGTKP